MTLVRRVPWQDLEGLQQRLQDVFGDTPFAVNAANVDQGQWAPPVDIRETEDALQMQVELPGINKEEITLEVKDGVLSISGERRYEKDVKEEHSHRTERVYGRFSRSFSLPRNVNADAVEASMKDGVLHVKMPKLDSAKAKAITIA
ncbi:MAG: heat-shock protein [Zetaproteobacteria bacterium CG_4_9_14_3_um_filter_49_83]|nr:MAG: heat-shock protein [Zetaproteobacteria bacterium CG1_02_49_23]PIQ32792.1 MAG: heat-shock protein [Zetaproteobacteria bacterium CG17_big_fil_post_rev_8_21_14_2_50_50_13]PIV29860.1 MAG: heat-shock protein [Zetaproteobacteria bacterium CG02_land_8_20_14_3_00_50_9]PIY56669.1 MAG: heat-shock protein [Zetaproteobacteria bacterium CG_4_10_14_0_8_um_filter_49_80]PJA33758.1 MAG: heat-shock protein [Zetaproteobacteria bacterium CG_4_9_14_3_um_filter_49_83]